MSGPVPAGVVPARLGPASAKWPARRSGTSPRPSWGFPSPPARNLRSQKVSLGQGNGHHFFLSYPCHESGSLTYFTPSWAEVTLPQRQPQFPHAHSSSTCLPVAPPEVCLSQPLQSLWLPILILHACTCMLDLPIVQGPFFCLIPAIPVTQGLAASRAGCGLALPASSFPSSHIPLAHRLPLGVLFGNLSVVSINLRNWRAYVASEYTASSCQVCTLWLS